MRDRNAEAPKAVVGKTETFFTRNVRLITFLICIAVFFAVFGPFSIFRIRDYIREHSDSRPELTADALIALAERPDGLFLSELESYRGTKQNHTVSVPDNPSQSIVVDVYWQADLAGGRYRCMAVAEPNGGRVTYLTVVDLRTGDRANVKEDSLRAFFGRN